ncbi:MAG: hypothetical protein JJT94_04250 [Bernardetiaceae bacterium]|nr:hypothetical protein [Bernardetiaceae bacterium]
MDIEIDDTQPDPYQDAKEELTAPPSKYEGLARVGFGNYLSGFGEALVTAQLSDALRLGADLYHLSAQRGAVDGRNSGSILNRFKVNADYVHDLFALRSHIFYRREGVHFYGYDRQLDPETINRDEIRQHWNTIGMQSQINDLALGSGVDYKLTLKASHTADRYEARETAMQLEGNTWYNSQLPIVIGIYTDNTLSSHQSQMRSLLSLAPVAKWKQTFFEIEGGLRFTYTNDSLFEKNIFLHPHAQASAHFLDKALQLRAAFTGAIEQNLLQDVAAQNPFIADNILLNHRNRRWATSLATTYQAMENLKIGITAEYAQYEQFAVFNNNQNDSSRFDMIYDNGKVNALSLDMSLLWRSTDFAVYASLGYRHYQTEALLRAWHLPNWDNEFGVSYTGITNLELSTSLLHQAGLYAQVSTSETEYSLPDIFNLQFKANYHLTDKFNAFAICQNLLSQSYQHFLFYEQRRIQAWAGIGYTF